MIAKIDKFWKDDDLYNLNNQYFLQHEFSLSDWFENEDSFQWFYHNKGFDLDKFKSTKAYRSFHEVTSKNSEYSVKHKKLNDANRIFLNNTITNN